MIRFTRVISPARRGAILLLAGALTTPAIATVSPAGERWVRVSHAEEVHYGVLDGDEIILRGRHPPWENAGPPGPGTRVPQDQVRWLAPVPGRAILGLHDSAHHPLHRPSPYVPAPPDLYARFPTSLAHPGSTLRLPVDSQSIVATPQLVILIGAPAGSLSPSEVDAVVAGYLLGVDLLEPAAYANRSWVMGRAGDGWAPIGPWINPGMPPAHLSLGLRTSNQAEVNYAWPDPAELTRHWVSRISRLLTLQAGDLIFLGVPPEVAAAAPSLTPGTSLEAWGEGLGTLRHTAVMDQTPPPLPPRPAILRLPAPAEGTREPIAWRPPAPTAKMFSLVRNAHRADSPAEIDFLAELEDRIRLKLPNALAQPGDAIRLPADSRNLDWEAEMVVVIGQTAHQVSVDQAWTHIAGYAVGNDVSENDWGGIFGKSGDGWAVVGNRLLPDPTWRDWTIKTWVNQHLVQHGSVADLRYTPAEVIAYLSRRITLHPGDMIFMGTVPRTPDSPAAIFPGDEITIRVPGLDTISNPVVAEPGRP
jgi:5-oxopent-3-ene-1,2,5-tricarboxylate decarboxylase / 2-hydroxyhepta-2,4-diene-1,7-dioate isomerase